jgi:hypothetical protein
MLSVEYMSKRNNAIIVAEHKIKIKIQEEKLDSYISRYYVLVNGEILDYFVLDHDRKIHTLFSTKSKILFGFDSTEDVSYKDITKKLKIERR